MANAQVRSYKFLPRPSIGGKVPPNALAQNPIIGDLEPPPEAGEPPPDGQEQQSPSFPFTRVGFEAGYIHQFDVNVKDGGSFDRDRFVISFGGRTQFSPKSGLSYNVGFRYDNYDFDGSGALGADPWDGINTLHAAGE